MELFRLSSWVTSIANSNLGKSCPAATRLQCIWHSLLYQFTSLGTQQLPVAYQKAFSVTRGTTFGTDANSKFWMHNLAKLTAYWRQEGCSVIDGPKKMSEQHQTQSFGTHIPETGKPYGINLGTWCRTQRRTKMCTKRLKNDPETKVGDKRLSHKQIVNLESIGFEWNMPYTHKENLRVGIIGGMGPDATVAFYQNVINKTRERAGASLDQDHILASIDMNCCVPDRQNAIISGKNMASCENELRESGARVRAAGCHFAVCVCNTAHFWEREIKQGLGQDIPFVSIIDITCDRVEEFLRRSNSGGIVGILAASGCVEGRLYQKELNTRGIRHYQPDKNTQASAMHAIYLAKAGRIAEGKQVFAEVLETLQLNGVNMVILGCTELPLLIPNTQVVPEAAVTCFDATDILAETVVDICTHKKELHDFISKL